MQKFQNRFFESNIIFKIAFINFESFFIYYYILTSGLINNIKAFDLDKVVIKEYIIKIFAFIIAKSF